MWGQASDGVNFDNCNRIIPTRVGTSRLVEKITHLGQDHPHACGDKVWSATTIFGIVGSSPRVWGQEDNNVLINSGTGIIPTRVGTRKIKAPHMRGLWDHPHACGDKRCARSYFNPYGGSSPRVWGQEVIKAQGYVDSGIIPTRVGTSYLKT